MKMLLYTHDFPGLLCLLMSKGPVPGRGARPNSWRSGAGPRSENYDTFLVGSLCAQRKMERPDAGRVCRRQLTSPTPMSAAPETPNVQQGKDPLIGRGLTLWQHPESPTLTKCRLSVCPELTESDLPCLPFSAVVQPEAHASIAHGDRSGGTLCHRTKPYPATCTLWC